MTHNPLPVSYTHLAEDEIAGICTAIGASFAGNFAVTTTSGPGLSLKSEALGLEMCIRDSFICVAIYHPDIYCQVWGFAYLYQGFVRTSMWISEQLHTFFLHITPVSYTHLGYA